MPGVSGRMKRGGVFLALVALTTVAGYADEPSPLDPPQVRVSPPIGAPMPQVRVLPPGGAPVPQNRISPPVGRPAPAPEPSLFDLFWMWLEAQAKISPPAG